MGVTHVLPNTPQKYEEGAEEEKAGGGGVWSGKDQQERWNAPKHMKSY